MRERIARDEGRRLFGGDAEAYDRARPGHADAVYEILAERGGLGPGAKVLEIGPGTGQATIRLLERGADPLVALEPDPALAAFLQDRFDRRIEIRPSTLETAELEEDFDLAAAASSFHWIDERVGLERIHGALRPGGSVALWWTLFGNSNRDDPFRDAVDPIMSALPLSPSHPEPGGPPYAADERARIAALERSRFEQVAAHRLEWTHTWDTEGTRGLFGTFSPILALPPEERDALLDEIANIAETQFGGRVTRPLVTALYTARRPS